MGSDVRIVGVCLLRNEEYFAAWSLMNIVDFCDRIIVMDNRSEDRTRRIVEAVAARHPHIEIIDVRDARRTHKYLEPLAGTPTWVFGVDGDEIYDPAGLAVLREQLLAGKYADYWRLRGYALHALGVQPGARGKAFGYSQPHAKNMCKLYNFNIIDSWRNRRQSLFHGTGRIVFKPGYSETAFDFWKQETWDEAILHCLHLCFMPRSSLGRELADGEFGRKNPSELHKERFLAQRIFRSIRRHFNPQVPQWRDYKKRTYAQGSVREFDIASFGAPEDFRAVDPDCSEAMAVLRAATERREREGLDAAAA